MSNKRKVGTGKEHYGDDKGCVHEDVVMEERVAAGENLIGRTVICRVQDIVCHKCGLGGVVFPK